MLQFLVDANVFVAAIKNPEKKARTLDLILELVSSEEIRLVGNDLLLLEFKKYSEKFQSDMALHLLKLLRDKMTIVELDADYIKNCIKYFPKNEIVDIVHAATCLQENSILITNDKHFDKISQNKIIEVWSISEAIENLL
ncbi:MAG: PIN domain-containing protein [Candidatus Methanoperedens sp.]|nr:MAG: PIN domain-containing protein [Candidatus Methanoperedens sp.]MCX9080355.1 PIN domain-containing protein [Candidatus Methanoperedens sp.]